MYVTLTGHDPKGGIKAKSRENWPSLTSMLSRFHNPAIGTPAAIRMPYSMYDNGTQMAGEGAGWLGSNYDPILLRTPAGARPKQMRSVLNWLVARHDAFRLRFR